MERATINGTLVACAGILPLYYVEVCSRHVDAFLVAGNLVLEQRGLLHFSLLPFRIG